MNIKRSLHLIVIVILIMFTNSCKDQESSKQAHINIQAFNTSYSDAATPANIIDTVYAINAPSRIVRRMREDQDGNLLIAAYTDVILYDGKTFSKIPKIPGFESFDAFDALQDSKGNIWIASTHFGVFFYDGKAYTQYTSELGLAHNRTIDIFEAKAGDIWISTMGGISRFEGNNIHNYSTKDGLPNNQVTRIIQDKGGIMWIGTRGSACIFDGKKFTVIKDEDENAFINIRHIIEDQRGHIWLGGSEGLWNFDGKSFTKITETMVGNIHQDHKGNIWVNAQSSDSYGWELMMFDSSSSSITKEALIKIKTEDSAYFGLFEYGEGIMWIGTGSGIFTYDGNQVTYFIDGDDTFK